MHLRTLLSLDSTILKNIEFLYLKGKTSDSLKCEGLHLDNISPKTMELPELQNTIHRLIEERNYLRKSNSVLLEKLLTYELSLPQTPENKVLTNKLFHLNYEFLQRTISKFREENERLSSSVWKAGKETKDQLEAKTNEISDLKVTVSNLQTSLNQARESLRAFLSGAPAKRSSQEESKTNMPPTFKINYTMGSVDSETNEGISDKLSFELKGENSVIKKAAVKSGTPLSKTGLKGNTQLKPPSNSKMGISKSPSSKAILMKESRAGAVKKKTMTPVSKVGSQRGLDGLGEDQFTQSVILDNKKKLMTPSRYPMPKPARKL